MGRKLSFYLLPIIAIGALFTGCQQTCSVPNQSPASVRIFDAVTNADTLNVFIDGKLFGIAYYNLKDYTGTSNSGYHQMYLSGGTALTAGVHHVAALVSGTSDTIVSTDVSFVDHDQTLVFFGRYHGTPAQHPQLKFLDDEERGTSPQNYIRLLEAVSDMSGIDVYFSNTVKISGGKPSPDLTLSYGEISDNHGGGTGTGRSPNDYFQIPSSDSTGLLITVKGDTSTKLFSFSEPFSKVQGFLFTLVVRGQSQPIDHEPSIDNVLLFDGRGNNGGHLDFESYYISLANATRLNPLNLLISSPTDQDPRIPRSPANSAFPSQNDVLNIASNSVGVYMPLTPIEGNAVDTLFNFWLSPTILPTDTIYHFTIRNPHENERYTFVAIDTMPLGFNGADYSEFTLVDTTGTPDDPGFGRIRFVNASPDHIVHFTFEGKSYSMKQRDVAFADGPAGSTSITVSDDTKSATVTFNVLGGRPITVFFMPATSTNDFPYTVVER